MTRLLTAACAALIGYEAYMMFVTRPMLRTEGERPIPIDAFASGATVTHAFRMNADGLHAVSLRFSVAQPSTLRVLCRLRRLPSAAPGDSPSQFGEVYRWTDRLSIGAGDSWQRIGFPSLGDTTGQWYAFEIQLLGAAPSANERSGSGPAVVLLASEDNPAGGGKLWIDGVRQPGSLFIRAYGGTKYEHFRLRVEPRLAPVLRNRIVQVFVVLIFHWALFTFAFGLVLEAGRGQDVRHSEGV